MKVLIELAGLYDKHLEEMWAAQNAHNEGITRAQAEFDRAQIIYNDNKTAVMAEYSRVANASRERLASAVNACLHGEPEGSTVQLPNIADGPKTTSTIEVTFDKDASPLTAVLRAVDEQLRQEAAE